MKKFFAIDGLDGSGKHTQYELLADYLTGRGLRVRKLDFPAYSRDSSFFVRMYLEGRLGASPDDTNAYAASMFFAADRYVSFVTDWKKDYLDPEAVLIADRYTTANAIHQLSKLPRSEWDGFLRWLFDFEYDKLSLPSPDTVIFLELPPEISLSMIESRSKDTGRARDIHESDGDFLRRSYEAGKYACGALGWVPVNCADSEGAAMRTRGEIFDDIRKIVDDALGL